jgi:hypothetical protein
MSDSAHHLHAGWFFLPYITTWDLEINAPIRRDYVQAVADSVVACKHHRIIGA